MKRKILKWTLRLTATGLLLFSCKKEDNKTALSTCDKILYNLCDGNGVGEYCTFGYKWGSNNPFSNAGLEKPGPAIGQVKITYKFQEAGLVFNTHAQSNVVSLSFDNNIIDCTKDQFRKALAEWESVTNVKFEEVLPSENSNMKIIVADISQDGLGYPAFSDSPCSELAGLIVFKKNYNINCESIYGIILHEIGHVLGLGHVNSNNVMNSNKQYKNLQTGDIKGIQTIYGKK